MELSPLSATMFQGPEADSAKPSSRCRSGGGRAVRGEEGSGKSRAAARNPLRGFVRGSGEAPAEGGGRLCCG